jgi:O-acetylhomoserine/O-acetylserine sulfhydrylase-like pyridoxal-dependent enzyme
MSRIPTFKTVEEEAAFWDSHDSTEFEAEFEDVTDVVFVRSHPAKGIIVPLDGESLAQLAQQARERGIAPATLARLWIVERLNALSVPGSGIGA